MGDEEGEGARYRSVVKLGAGEVVGVGGRREVGIDDLLP